jgi:hypothetical protein
LGRCYMLDEVITALNSQGIFDLKISTGKCYISGAIKRNTISAIFWKF